MERARETASSDAVFVYSKNCRRKVGGIFVGSYDTTVFSKNVPTSFQTPSIGLKTAKINCA